jgi:hypothetical protein
MFPDRLSEKAAYIKARADELAFVPGPSSNMLTSLTGLDTLAQFEQLCWMISLEPFLRARAASHSKS